MVKECSRCGRQNDGQNRFCGMCGARLAESADAVPPVTPFRHNDDLASASPSRDFAAPVADSPAVSSERTRELRARGFEPIAPEPLSTRSPETRPLDAPTVSHANDSGFESAHRRLEDDGPRWQDESAPKPAFPSRQDAIAADGRATERARMIEEAEAEKAALRNVANGTPIRRDTPVSRDVPLHSDQVNGPSFLGLAETPPSDNVVYLLEDEGRAPHWGRIIGALVILGAFAFAAWYWRDPLMALAGIHSQNGTQVASNGTTSYSSAPISTSGSEMPNSQSFQPAGGANSTPPPAQPPATAAANPPAQPKASAAPGSKGSGDNTAEDMGDKNDSAPSQQAAASTPPPASAAPKPSAEMASKTPAAKPKPQPEDNAEDQPSGAVTKASRVTKERDVEPADAGSALETQGENYLYGRGTPANCGMALNSLTRAADYENSKAYMVLGTMYATGHCAPLNAATAYRWFAKASHKQPGNAMAVRELQVLWAKMTPQERQLAIQR